MPMVAEVMDESGARLRRARPDRRDARTRQLHRRAHRHCRRARPGAGHQRQTVRHRQSGGDGEACACGAMISALSHLPSRSMRRRGMLYFGLYDARRAEARRPAADRARRGLRLCFRPICGSRSGAARVCSPRPAARHGRSIEATLPELQPSAAALAEIAYESGETVADAAAALSAAARRQAAGASGVEALMPVEILVARATPLDAPLMAALHARCFARAVGASRRWRNSFGARIRSA